MAVSLTWEETGVEQLVKELGGLEKRAANLAPAFAVTANLLEGHVQQIFETEGARIGARWRGLKASTIKARARGWGYYGTRLADGASARGPILRWSGRLQRSFKRGGVAHLRMVSALSLRWGSGVRYGAFHDKKGPRRRPILAFRNEFQRREILFQPVRLHIQGVPPGAIMATLGARLRIGATGAPLSV